MAYYVQIMRGLGCPVVCFSPVITVISSWLPLNAVNTENETMEVVIASKWLPGDWGGFNVNIYLLYVMENLPKWLGIGMVQQHTSLTFFFFQIHFQYSLFKNRQQMQYYFIKCGTFGETAVCWQTLSWWWTGCFCKFCSWLVVYHCVWKRDWTL